MSQQQDIPNEVPPLVQDPATADADSTSHAPPHFFAEKTFSTNSFNVEDSFYRARMTKALHWSVAWSDLMMTMFILFLTMFVYQASHEEFLVSKTPEIVGGSTSDALDILGNNDLIVPIIPMTRKKPTISSESLSKAEKVVIDDLDIAEVFRDNVVFVEPATGPPSDTTTTPQAEDSQRATAPGPPAKADIIEPAPLGTRAQPIPEIRQSDTFSEMYDMSQQALSEGKLDKFAAIELVPDKTMRIILTGDLLFFHWPGRPFTQGQKITHETCKSHTTNTIHDQCNWSY